MMLKQSTKLSWKMSLRHDNLFLILFMLRNPVIREVGCLLLKFLRSVQMSLGGTPGVGLLFGTSVGMILDKVSGGENVLPLEGDVLPFEGVDDAALAPWPTL